MPTLLQKAKDTKVTRRGRVASKEEIELALSWANDEISYSQVTSALGKKNHSAYALLALALKSHLNGK